MVSAGAFVAALRRRMGCVPGRDSVCQGGSRCCPRGRWGWGMTRPHDVRDVCRGGAHAQRVWRPHCLCTLLACFAQPPESTLSLCTAAAPCSRPAWQQTA
eukprot:350394-Chlamydomonas_euryale.AAC.2